MLQSILLLLLIVALAGAQSNSYKPSPLFKKTLAMMLGNETLGAIAARKECTTEPCKAAVEAILYETIGSFINTTIEDESATAFRQVLRVILEPEGQLYANASMAILEGIAQKGIQTKGQELNMVLHAVTYATRAAHYLRGNTNWQKHETYGKFLRESVLPLTSAPITEVFPAVQYEAEIVTAVYLEDALLFSETTKRYLRLLATSVPRNDGTLPLENFFEAQQVLGSLIAACEVAWAQGIDLYSARNNVLHKVTEHYANLVHDSIMNILCLGWEIVHNHFVNRLGIPMPNTEKVMKEIHQYSKVLMYTIHIVAHLDIDKKTA